MPEARTKQSSGARPKRSLLLANLRTLGVVGAQLRGATSSELRFRMNSGATPAPTMRAGRHLQIA
jgi:hypothetical protein